MSAVRAVAALVTTLLMVTGVGPDVQPTASANGTRSAYTKVMVIVEENRTYGDIIGSARAPYLNRLATTYGSAKAMQAGYPTQCPSLAAYLLMTSGSTHGVCDDSGPQHHPIAGDNIFAQVAGAGLTWRNYAEGAPGPCARHNTEDGVFLARHTPAPYYLSERDRCMSDDVPMGAPARGALHDDLAAGNLPSYAYLSPDACHDMHGATACPTRGVQTGDAWLAQWIPQIQSERDYRAGHLVIIITWDEGSRTSNQIPTLVISPTTERVSSAVPYNHCSTLATAEDLLHLPRLGCAAHAMGMTSAFHL